MVKLQNIRLWWLRQSFRLNFNIIIMQLFQGVRLVFVTSVPRLTQSPLPHSKGQLFRGGKSVTDPDQSERLAQLEARINKLKSKDAPVPHQDTHYSQAHLAWRMVIELVVGLLIGFGIGYGLDSLFGTLPIFLLLFTLLGLAAGIKTMMRSAQEIQNNKMADAAEDTSPDTGGEKRAKDGD